MVDLDRCLEIAKSAALLAGEFILKSQDSDLEVLSSTGRDLKLQLDIDAENTIKKYLTLYSSYAILGEETGLSNKLNEVYWVIDPLDGTSNFLRKIPISCVSIALMNEKKPILGVIYDFNHNEIFFGHIKSKAFMNEQAISVSSLSSKNESTLMTGIPAKTHYSDDEFKKLIGNFQAWKKIRMIGSAAMAAAYVAAGKAETYQEDGIFLWDIAAGAAIVKAAGGDVSLQNFQPDYRVDAIFTNGKIKD